MAKQGAKQTKREESTTVNRSVELSLENFRENLYHITYGKQGKVAEAAGMCARQHLNEIMSGKYCPSLKTALLISEAVGIPLEDLFRSPASLDIRYPHLAARKKARKILSET